MTRNILNFCVSVISILSNKIKDWKSFLFLGKKYNNKVMTFNVILRCFEESRDKEMCDVIKPVQLSTRSKE